MRRENETENGREVVYLPEANVHPEELLYRVGNHVVPVDLLLRTVRIENLRREPGHKTVELVAGTIYFRRHLP